MSKADNGKPNMPLFTSTFTQCMFRCNFFTTFNVCPSSELKSNTVFYAILKPSFFTAFSSQWRLRRKRCIDVKVCTIVDLWWLCELCTVFQIQRLPSDTYCKIHVVLSSCHFQGQSSANNSTKKWSIQLSLTDKVIVFPGKSRLILHNLNNSQSFYNLRQRQLAGNNPRPPLSVTDNQLTAIFTLRNSGQFTNTLQSYISYTLQCVMGCKEKAICCCLTGGKDLVH